MEFMKISNTKIFGQIPILVLYMATVSYTHLVEFRFAELKKDFGIVGASELVLD